MVLKNGIPSEDTFLRIFRLLDPKGFETCFRRWVSQVVTQLSGTIAVDGKTVRGSGTSGEQAIHMVSAFATELGLVLGQEKVASKSNEITAIPELLDALTKHFLDHQFDLKDLVRTICKSSVYQLSSEPTESNKSDQQNYSSFYPRRMSAEVLYDSVNAVADTPSNFGSIPQGTTAVQLPDDGFCGRRAEDHLVHGAEHHTSLVHDCPPETLAFATLGAI